MFPQSSVAVGFLYVVARLIYTVCYIKWGSDAREIGAVSGTLPAVMLGLASFVSLFIAYVL